MWPLCNKKRNVEICYYELKSTWGLKQKTRFCIMELISIVTEFTHSIENEDCHSRHMEIRQWHFGGLDVLLMMGGWATELRAVSLLPSLSEGQGCPLPGLAGTLTYLICRGREGSSVCPARSVLFIGPVLFNTAPEMCPCQVARHLLLLLWKRP